MILLREYQERDIDTLAHLAQIPGFFNLTTDKDILKEKLVRSQKSFSDSIENKWDSKFIFVAEDMESGKVVGTSMIASQHGTPESPHFYFEVGNEEKFSETINTGFIHGTLKLKYDTNGPSEIGGLVIDPEFRNSTERMGRQISFVRFLYLGIHKQKFKRKIIAELLPPLNKKGQSPLWEAVGRRFTNMDYWEADQLCVKNKEFIFSLFPTGKIYTTFFPAEAKNSIGKVSKDTEPVLHMLKKIGFTYKNQIDPFDGGPHLWANVDELVPVKKIHTGALSKNSDPAGPTQEVRTSESGLICASKQEPGKFRAVAAQVELSRGKIHVNAEGYERLSKALELKEGDQVHFMPFY